jgi:hypothetical protein
MASDRAPAFPGANPNIESPDFWSRKSFFGHRKERVSELRGIYDGMIS